MRELNLGSGLGNVRELLKKDFKDVFTKNPIVVLTLLAIIILPSLYALINIQACWDPYDNTGNLEFAVANLDKGATFDGEDINVGDQLEDELKRNDDFYFSLYDFVVANFSSICYTAEKMEKIQRQRDRKRI